MEAAREDVNEKAADEHADGKRHRLLAIAPLDPIIFPFERDSAVLQRDQPAVGDGDAMGVAGEIGQHGLGPAERSLGIDDPFGLAERIDTRTEHLTPSDLHTASNTPHLPVTSSRPTV